MKKECEATRPRARRLREIHTHSVGGYAWMGVVYIEGTKCAEIEPMASIEAVERLATQRYGDKFKLIIWAQDDGMILSES